MLDERRLNQAEEALDDIIRQANIARESLRNVRTGLKFGMVHQENLDQAMNYVCVIIQDSGEHAHGCLLDLGANGGL